MNIGISALVTSKELTGVGRYLLFLVDALQKADDKNQYYIFVSKELSPLFNITEANFTKIIVDIPHSPRVIMRPVYFFWQNFLSGRYIEDLQLDVFHIPNPIPIFTNNANYVITVHDIAEFRYIPRYSYFKQQFRKWATGLSIKKAKAILTVSDFSKNEIRSVFESHSSNIRVTKPGLTINGYQQRERLNKSSFFLHVGGGNRNKNMDRLLSAFLKFDKDKKLRLKLVGHPEPSFLKNKSKKEWEQLGVFYYAYVSDRELIDLYSNAIALLYPSLYEGFGLPIIEAMACRTPVITSNTASMPEVGGDAAVYVDPYDINSISNAMRKMLDDETFRQEYIERGLKRAKTFDWESTARKTIEAYQAVYQSNKNRDV